MDMELRNGIKLTRNRKITLFIANMDVVKVRQHKLL